MKDDSSGSQEGMRQFPMSLLLRGIQSREAEEKLWIEQAKERVLEKTKGQNITATELRREQMSELLDTGLKASKVAAIMDCSHKMIYKIIRMKRAGESLAPKFTGRSGRPRSARTEEFTAKVREMHADNH